MPAPAHPKIYHITHVDNLPTIIADGALFSDAVMIARGGPAAAIGMSSIKERRLALPVTCHTGDCVGDFVPFYFCPRSIMLYLIHCANHPELTYRGGQTPIVHLEADLNRALDWADAHGRHWAFSLSNAGAAYAQFRSRREALDEIDWEAVATTDFRPPEIKEGKQAEFLVRDSFPWALISRIGVHSVGMRARVAAMLKDAPHQPRIDIVRQWYF